VSVRTAHLVINALEEQTFVDKRRGAIRLAKAGPLLDLWAENYRLDQHRRQTFYSFIRSPRELATKLAAEARSQRLELGLTLHAGAALVAPFVRYTDVHAYVAGDIDRLVKAFDLRPVETGGGVHLLTPNDDGVFYAARTIDGLPVVSDVQLYLDLLHYPARGREQAEELRRRKLGY
jgi:Transcriptional regulator, AbiEi antitoxin, Type IV TA system